MTDNKLNRFLGGSPGQVLLRLVFLSFVAGIIMAALDLNPLDLVQMTINFFERLWSMGFQALGRIGGYLAAGLVVVVPVWLVFRILAMGRRP